MQSFSSGILGWLSDALFWVPAVIISLSVHEFAHAFVAYKCGDPTAKNLGRMTINPLKHVDPIGLIMMLLVHYGWAKPVPVNYRNFGKPKRDIFLVSVAGIASNFIMAFIVFGIWFGLLMNGQLDTPVMRLLSYFYVFNLNIMVFNLIPVFPLDGYRIVKNFLPYGPVTSKITFFLEKYGMLLLVALLLSNIVSSVMSITTSGVSALFVSIYSGLFNLFGGM